MSNNIDVVQCQSKEDSASGLSLFKDIPKFSGNEFNDSTPQEMRIFIRKVEVAAQFSKVGDLVSIAYMKLTGAASRFAVNDPDIQNAITDGDWAAFKSKLLKVYAPRHSWTNLELSILNSKQREQESCREFLSRLRTLKDDTMQANEIQETSKTPEEIDEYSRSLDHWIFRRFCNGLRSQLAVNLALCSKDSKTVDELADLVADFEIREYEREKKWVTPENEIPLNEEPDADDVHYRY